MKSGWQPKAEAKISAMKSYLAESLAEKRLIGETYAG